MNDATCYWWIDLGWAFGGTDGHHQHQGSTHRRCFILIANIWSTQGLLQVQQAGPSTFKKGGQD